MRRVKEAVPLAECRRRALAALGDNQSVLPASSVAEAIWPGASWRAAQGAGAAASRVLKVLERDGLARWTVLSNGSFGWLRTPEGRRALAGMPAQEAA